MLFLGCLIRVLTLFFAFFTPVYSFSSVWYLQPLADGDAHVCGLFKDALRNNTLSLENRYVLKKKWFQLFDTLDRSVVNQSALIATVEKSSPFLMDEFDAAPDILKNSIQARLLLVVTNCFVKNIFDRIHLLTQLRTYWRYYQLHSWGNTLISLPHIIVNSKDIGWSIKKKIRYLDLCLAQQYNLLGHCIRHVSLLNKSIDLEVWNWQLIDFLSFNTQPNKTMKAASFTGVWMLAQIKELCATNDMFFKKGLHALHRYHVIKPPHIHRQWISYLFAAAVGYAVYKNLQNPQGITQRIFEKIEAAAMDYIVDPIDNILCVYGYNQTSRSGGISITQNRILAEADHTLNIVINRYNSDEAKEELTQNIQSTLNKMYREYRRCMYGEMPDHESTLSERAKSVLWNVAAHNPISKIAKYGSGTAINGIVSNSSDQIMHTVTTKSAAPLAHGFAATIKFIFDDVIKQNVLHALKEKYGEYATKYRVERALLGLVPSIIVGAMVWKSTLMLNELYKRLTESNYKKIQKALIPVQEYCIALHNKPTDEQYGKLLYYLHQLDNTVHNSLSSSDDQYDRYKRLVAMLQRFHATLQERHMIIEILKSIH